MTDPFSAKKKSLDSREGLRQEVEKKSIRKQKARREADRSLWFGLGMFGLVGWSVAIPTLIGVAAGIWIDMTWPSRFSWTLMLLFLGIVLGCLNAWYWMSQKRAQIAQEDEEKYE